MIVEVAKWMLVVIGQPIERVESKRILINLEVDVC